VGKNIVVLCDGTWNSADQKCPTNVAKFRLAAVDEPGRQVVKYVPGVGTDPGFFDRFLGGAFGFGLSARVLEAYRYVAENYEDGDRIYLLGFSRGAYTARSTAGMIRNVGVLRSDARDEPHYRQALAIYRNRTSAAMRPDGDDAVRFRAAHSFSPGIRFVGVWDTVGALGIPLGGLRRLNVINRRWQFHDTQLSSTIAAAYHALAIDERRGPFQPTLWQLSGKQREGGEQQVEQVWFTGVHSNIGGGYPDSGLSDIALNWMAAKAYEHGVEFRAGQPAQGGGRAQVLQKWVATDPRPDGTLVNSRTGVYRLMRPAVRRLGEAHSSSTEAAFFTAARRWDDDVAYRGAASNLKTYLTGRDHRILPADDPEVAAAPDAGHPAQGEGTQAA
jgi:uncharacterized protein (DUF2235 family)